jgi:hypothetical protein
MHRHGCSAAAAGTVTTTPITAVITEMVDTEVETVVVVVTIAINIDIATASEPTIKAIKDGVALRAIVAAKGAFDSDDVLTVVLRQISQNGQSISGRHRRNNPIDAEIILKETAKVDAVAIASAINTEVEAGNFVVIATIDGQIVSTTVTNVVSATSKTVTIVVPKVIPATTTTIAATTTTISLTAHCVGAGCGLQCKGVSCATNCLGAKCAEGCNGTLCGNYCKG